MTQHVPWWRALLGVVVTIVGTCMAYAPMMASFAAANDYKNGNCPEPGTIHGVCGYTAVQGYAASLALLVAPTLVGLLIARPRGVGTFVGAVLALAAIAYLLLTFTGETIPTPAETIYGTY